MGEGEDVLQAYFDKDAQQLHFRLRRCATIRHVFQVVIGRKVSGGRWTLCMNGSKLAEGIGATVSSSSMRALRSGEEGLQLETTRFALSIEPD